MADAIRFWAILPGEKRELVLFRVKRIHVYYAVELVKCLANDPYRSVKGCWQILSREYFASDLAG